MTQLVCVPPAVMVVCVFVGVFMIDGFDGCGGVSACLLFHT